MTTGIDAIRTGAPVTATGGVLFADPGTETPVTAEEAVTGFTEGGYIGEDGVTRTIDASDEKIRAWGGDTVKIVRTEHSITYTWQFLESANAAVLRLINGDENVSVDAETQTVTVKHTAKIPPRKAFILDMFDDGKALREVIKNGQLTSSGDVSFVHSDVIRYEVTVEAFPDEEGVKAISLVENSGE
jgi:hypothetical protein